MAPATVKAIGESRQCLRFSLLFLLIRRELSSRFFRPAINAIGATESRETSWPRPLLGRFREISALWSV